MPATLSACSAASASTSRASRPDAKLTASERPHIVVTTSGVPPSEPVPCDDGASDDPSVFTRGSFADANGIAFATRPDASTLSPTLAALSDVFAAQMPLSPVVGANVIWYAYVV